MTEPAARRLAIFQSSLTYRDERLAGLDAAVLMEVIEHVDPPRLAALERAVFGHAAPPTVIVTTPNVEYNVRFETLPPGTLRHRDHRFEWTRAEFRAWAAGSPSATATASRFLPVGADDPEVGPPTQMAVFDKAQPSGARRDAGMTHDRARGARAEPRRADRRQRLGQVHVRARALQPTEVISSDFCRGLVADDENDQSATADAFELLHLHRRQAAGGRAADRRRRHQRAARRAPRSWSRWPASTTCCRSRSCSTCRRASAPSATRARPDRDFGAHVIRRQHAELRRVAARPAAGGLPDRPRPARRGRDRRRDDHPHRLYNDLRHETGPFDVIGDVHGCRAELEALLAELGYAIERDDEPAAPVGAQPPGPAARLRRRPGRPRPGHARRAAAGHGHGRRRRRALRARQPREQAACAPCAAATCRSPTAWPSRSPSSRPSPAEFRAEAERFIDGLVSHYVLDGGQLVVAHAGLTERYQGRASGRVREFCLYGETTGETDEYGLPVRYPWAQEYRGRAMVLYGHTPVPDAGVDQQHALPRHRLRVRRQAHRAALPGARARLGPGRPGLLRAGQAVPGQPAAPRARRRRPLTASPTSSTSPTSPDAGSSRRATSGGSGSARRTRPPRWR